MNLLYFLKNGSTIQIKKKNRGKFTKFCGGRVTQKCIDRGKRSSNVTTRKRAIFADNARHFKHLKGGVVKAKDGTSFSTKVGNFMNSDWGQLAMNGVSSIIQGIQQNKKIASDADVAKSSVDMNANISKEQAKKQAYAQGVQMLNNIQDANNPNAFGGEIFQKHFLNKYVNENTANIQQEANAQKKMIDAQASSQQASNIGGIISNLAQNAMGIAGNYFNNKQQQINYQNALGKASQTDYLNNYKSMFNTSTTPQKLTGTQLANSITIKNK